MDGTEQRFRDRAAALREWRLDLRLLEPDELHALEQFFVSMQGAAGCFSFQDPWDGLVYPRCRFVNDDLEATIEEVLRGRVSLLVREEPGS